ncbi:spore germination protein GerPE [Brevibacillus formosus]|uniref:spore germination protein GerPE n=1 Tax=Brevibacillus TaxID=55080 RepID=UPI000D0F024F|nr:MULTISPECIES: spore germination protein GerPE [Brevibacillus]MBG9944894.1 spore gernimation protein [Brevibacillus formosus]MED1947403.1 spore germination protein GerPE [Brevibacillus formosus]MED1997330.1 spore germination protein GerPE [Brevibacillus formosus]MED2083187.1 spore germination protein GerPE [Brevibacillus formosus]PSK16990.1 spore germination protein GerPE [Brevibacillus sp. NRRL NRS-603]
MYRRTSHVHKLDVISVDTSSVLQIGDSQQIDAVSNILAVQREQAIFYENEFMFEDYSVFSVPLTPPSLSEPICIDTFHDCPYIFIRKVEVPFVAGASVVHLGSNESITLETRIVNIRHIFQNDPNAGGRR